MSHPFSKSEWRAESSVCVRVRALLSHPISPLRREQQLLPPLPSPCEPGQRARTRAPRTRTALTRRRRCSGARYFSCTNVVGFAREPACHLPDTQSALVSPPPLFVSFFFRQSQSFSNLGRALVPPLALCRGHTQPWDPFGSGRYTGRPEKSGFPTFTPFARIRRGMCQLATECFNSARSFVLLYFAPQAFNRRKTLFFYVMLNS